MGAKTGIEWTGSTWNPVVGCDKVSQGCKRCYAKTLHDMRHKAYLEGKSVPVQYAQPFEVVQLKPERLDMPLRWKRPRMVFVDSVSDLFHDDVPLDFIVKVFAVMAMARQHTFQVLTKRAERMAGVLSGQRFDVLIEKAIEEICAEHGWCPQDFEWPLPNVWMGVSVEDQAMADKRIPWLLRTPAAIRFLSCEPLLERIDLVSIGSYGFGQCLECSGAGEVAGDYFSVDNSSICESCGGKGEDDNARVDWIITGGESGQDARPMHPEWAKFLREQCLARGVPFFFKQWGEWLPESQMEEQMLGRKYHKWPDGSGSLWVGKQAAGHLLDGDEWRQMP